MLMSNVKNEVYCKRCRYFKPPIQFTILGATKYCCNSCYTNIHAVKPKTRVKPKSSTKLYTDNNITNFKRIYLSNAKDPILP